MMQRSLLCGWAALAVTCVALGACGGGDGTSNGETSGGGAGLGGSGTEAGATNIAGATSAAGATNAAGTGNEAGVTNAAGTGNEAGAGDGGGADSGAAGANSSAICGNGVIEDDEACDDGQTANEDGCDGSCQLEPGWDCADEPSTCTCESWVLSFDLTGQFEIADTFLGAGDGTFTVSPGTLTLRLESGPSGLEPGDGAVVLLEYAMHQEFDQDIPLLGGQVQTNVDATAGPDEPACGRATGSLSGSTLTWDACPTSDNYGQTDWSPDDALAGPGCVRGYHSEGMVVCTSSETGCSQGNLVRGDNPQDDTWDQPFGELTIDLENGTVAMGRTQIPNRADSSTTWLSFSGTEASRTCEAAPANCD